MKNLTFIIFLILFISCNNQKIKFNPKSIELDNKGVNKMIDRDYQTALSLFDKAIKLDSSYYFAYNNKVTVLVRLKRFDEAIKTNILSLKQKPDLAEGHFFLGMLWDYEGDSIKAKESYLKAIQIFKKRIASEKITDSDELNLATAYIFINEKDKANMLFNKLLLKEKNKETVQLICRLTKEEILRQSLDIE